MRVAVVEDNAITGLDLVIALQEAGHEAVGPFCRLEQVQALGADEAPDVALLDLHLGHGECGARIGRYLADRFGTTAVFVTADARAAQANAAHALGYVLKPVGEADVLDLVAWMAAWRAGALERPAPRKLHLSAADAEGSLDRRSGTRAPSDRGA